MGKKVYFDQEDLMLAMGLHFGDDISWLGLTLRVTRHIVENHIEVRLLGLGHYFEIKDLLEEHFEIIEK
jgi:hypothetical protein